MDYKTRKEIIALLDELDEMHEPLTEKKLVDARKLPSFGPVYEHKVVGKPPLDHEPYEHLHEGPSMDPEMRRCPPCRQIVIQRRLREIVKSL